MTVARKRARKTAVTRRRARGPRDRRAKAGTRAGRSLRSTRDALHSARSLVDAMVDSAPVLFVVRDAKGRILRFNRLAEATSGVRAEDALGETLWDLVLDAEDARLAREQFGRALSGRAGKRMQLEWRHRDGTTRIVEWRSARFDAPDASHCVVSTGLDVTEQRNAELRTSARIHELAALYRVHTANELAATLAHELTQPLTAIASLSEATRKTLQANANAVEGIAANLDEIRDQALRAGRYIGELRRFVAQGEITPTTLDLNALARAATTLTAPLARRSGVQLLLGLAPDLAPVRAAEIQIEHVITNLVRNAIESIEHAGLRSGQVRVTTHALDRRTACLSVIDTGPGIASDKLKRLFEPFYSTKPQGLGMGLRVSRTIVEAHGGRLWAEAGPGGILRFTLPVAR